MPDGTFMCSASYKGDATGEEVLEVVHGTRTIRSLFSKEQLAFFDAHAPAGIDMNSLRVQGPVLVLKAKHRPKEYKRGITVEAWFWQDGKHILELSTKTTPAEAFQTGVEFRSYLEDQGVDLGTEQETKTKTAMQKFKASRKVRRRARGARKASRRVA
jgi:hypothetical protein